MRIRHLGHSGLLVEVAGTRLLVDPGTLTDQAAVRELRDLDAIVITHQHADHVDPVLLADVLASNPGARVIAEPETAAALREHTPLPGGSFEGTLDDGRLVSLAAGQDTSVGPLTLRAVGGEHAVIHPDIPRVGNSGLVLEADGEPRLGITGDSIEPVPEFVGIDVLAFAVVAPWSKMRETIDFLREVRPVLALPVHDAIVSPAGRPIFVNQSTNLAPSGTEVRDWPEDRTVVVDR